MSTTHARVRCMADVQPENVEWLWGGRIPRGKLSEVVGDPGEGKSTLVIQIVACISRGLALPGDPDDRSRAPERVLLLSAEDGPGDTIRPRLDSAGADPSCVHIFDGIEDDEGTLSQLDLKSPDHRRRLAEVVSRLCVTLVVIDPITSYLGATDLSST